MQPCGLRDLARPRRRQSFGLKAGRVAGYARGTLAERGLKNIHATLRAAGFGAPLGATFVWPQDWASCGMYPQNLSRKGAKKTIMQTCGLRKWARPRGLRSFGLKAGRVAGYARSSWAQRALKNIRAALRAAGFGAPLGATVVWPQNQAICGLRSRHLGRKGAKKHSCNPAGCGIWRILGATFVWPQGRASCGLRPRHLGPKGSKKYSCNPAGCGIWRALGGDGRLASKPSDLRTASVAPWPKGR